MEEATQSADEGMGAGAMPIDTTTGLPAGSPVLGIKAYAWAVEYGNGLVALFLDRGRAEKATRDMRGSLVRLVRG